MAAEYERSYDKSLEDLVAAEEDGALDAGPHGTMHSVSFRPGWEKDPAIAAWCDLSGVGPAKIITHAYFRAANDFRGIFFELARNSAKARSFSFAASCTVSSDREKYLAFRKARFLRFRTDTTSK